MKSFLLSLLGAALLAQLGTAAEIIDIKDGPTLAAHLRHLFPQEGGHFQGSLQIDRRQGSDIVIPFKSETRVQADSWEITYESTATGGIPAQKLTVIHFPDQPNTYLFASATNGGAIGPQQKLSGAQVYMPFANSDFWLVDLGLDFFHWPHQKMLEPQMRRSRPCKVLESRPGNDSASPYSKVISWIDNESGGILRAEAYDKNQKRLKEFSIGSFEDRRLRSMEMQDLRTHGSSSRTLLEFDLNSEPRADSKP